MKLINLVMSVTLLFATAALVPTTASAQTINQRLKNQHRRIDEGVKHGSMSRNHARRLHARDKMIHAREHRDRMAQHGHLTGGERVRLQRSLNRTSRAIYRAKHNGKSPN